MKILLSDRVRTYASPATHARFFPSDAEFFRDIRIELNERASVSTRRLSGQFILFLSLLSLFLASPLLRSSIFPLVSSNVGRGGDETFFRKLIPAPTWAYPEVFGSSPRRAQSNLSRSPSTPVSVRPLSCHTFETADASIE